MVTAVILLKPQESETITKDGAWNWFTEPRAVRHRDQTYVGWVSKDGDVRVSSLNHATDHQQMFTLKEGLGIDDHNNPSLLVRPDGKLMAFYSAHNGQALFYRTTQRPEDITEWDTEKTVGTNSAGSKGYTYPNPVQLSAEDNIVYLFWRGADWQPTFATSPDDGQSWTPAQTFITLPYQRPYVKYVSNGSDTIHFVFTDGHPREYENNIYYAYYQAGQFWRSDHSLIKSLNDGPLSPSEAERIYTNPGNGSTAWLWDLALKPDGNPCVVYTALTSFPEHHYRYLCRHNDTWEDHVVADGGGSIAPTSEPAYSGGIALDHADPSIVYYAHQVAGNFEITKAVAQDRGATWTRTLITHDSPYPNFRPIVPWGTPTGVDMVLWLAGKYTHYTQYHTAITMWRTD